MPEDNIVQLAPRTVLPQEACSIGTFVAWNQGPMVTFEGDLRGGVLARSIVTLTEIDVLEAITNGGEVLLAFAQGRADSPIIVGLLQPTTPLQDTEEIGREDDKVEAKVDGKRIVLEADNEIVLKCGKSSLTLRRNGRVVIRGAYVETRSSGVNRIRGGSVSIN